HRDGLGHGLQVHRCVTLERAPRASHANGARLRSGARESVLGSSRGEAPRLNTMPERVWYKSLYWRIALGYVALLALLMLVQTGLSLWVMDRMWGGSNRTPEQLAELVAQDLSGELAKSPQLDVERHLSTRYGTGYQPFIVMLRGDTRTLSNRPNAIPNNLGREARGRLMGRPADWLRGGPPDGGRGGGSTAPGRGGGPGDAGRGGPDGRRGGSRCSSPSS